MTIGRSATTAYVVMNRRSASAHIGSRSSSGLLAGGRIGVASSCGPTAMRTCAKSASSRRRSHNRGLAGIDHNACGSGWR
jgi:hypothetical protein